MKKNTIKLTESQFQKLIKESVNSLLNEGHWDSSVYDEFEKVREAVGDDTLISELYNWLDGDSIEDFIEHMNRNYELVDSYDDEEDELW